MTGTPEGHAVQGIGSSAESITVRMRKLALDLNDLGTDIDQEPDGWRDAHLLIQGATMLAALAQRLDGRATGREAGA
jgi:hypothetical protein